MNLLPKDGTLLYFPHFFSKEESQSFFETLIEKIAWKQDQIKMFGKVMNLPRLTAWYGDPGTEYRYSGILNVPHPWTHELLEIKIKVEEVTGCLFNSLLLNRYQSGTDYVSWHADNESSLGVNPCIASVSFGETRVFELKHKTDKVLSPIRLEIESGSLVIMRDEIQDYWLHRIVPTKKPKKERINLTFRYVDQK